MEQQDTTTSGVVAPPPLIFGVGLALGLGLHARFPARLVDGPSRAVGGLLVAMGSGLIAWAIATLRRAGTDPRPDRPTAALVTRGPYRLTRNPIYVGFTGVYCGLLVLVGTPWPALFLLPILSVMRHGVISREERYLARRFGEAYSAYAAQVRRWI
jgi:protein-S-isoprenylcysteine O-methyltransferase Ste14